MIYQNDNFGKSYDYRSGWHDEFVVYEHLHDYSEILLCLKGEADISVRGRKILLRAGELAFISPNIVHEYRCRNCEVLCAVFSNDYIHLLFKQLDERELMTKPVDVSDMPYLIEKLLKLDHSDTLSINSCLSLICERVMKSATFEEQTPHDTTLYQKVIGYVSEHYSENITLKSVAKKFGYNEKYLSFTLHQLTGINFRRFVSMYRINHARKLLETDSRSITEVAYASGFSAVNSFNRIFFESVGMTPLEYRNKYRL